MTAMFLHSKRQIAIPGGFSLLEVLVAGAVMSSGLAGLAALLMQSVAGTAQAAHQTTALMLAESMGAAMSLSAQAGNRFLLPPPSTAPLCGSVDACSGNQFADSGWLAWSLQVNRHLPGGRGFICRDESPEDGSALDPNCSGSGPVVVKIFWQEGRLVRPVHP